MNVHHDLQAVIRSVAHALQKAFDDYYAAFYELTNAARSRFEQREWDQVLQDAVDRIGLYHTHLNAIEKRIRGSFGEQVYNRKIWEELKQLYILNYLHVYYSDLALIFFYSVMRRIFMPTMASIEYSEDIIRDSLESRLEESQPIPYTTYNLVPLSAALIQEIVQSYEFKSPFAHLDTDAELAAKFINRSIKSRHKIKIDMLKNPFFRNKSAYLMGRIRLSDRTLPLIFVLLHPSEGIVIDAVLTEASDVSNVITSARSNFHVWLNAYREVVNFLKNIAPSRSTPYLYTAIGFIHPAKLELVKLLRNHLKNTGELFHQAKGIPGTVMVAFTLETFAHVFKVVRDTSSKPTFQGRKHVIQQYWKVHRDDRVGRMLDIMTFHNLRFPKNIFEKKLLNEILLYASESAQSDGEDIIFKHLYAEREVIPLNLFLADENISEEKRKRAAIDYGHAIKDLAVAGIFVGDYMTKNFGVTQFGRVVLYDYDDIDDLKHWNFRDLPEPPEWAEMLPFEDWLSKGDRDVFPGHDFRSFLLPRNFEEDFLQHHADLLTPEFWNRIKSDLKKKIPSDFFPYSHENRLVKQSPSNSSPVFEEVTPNGFNGSE